MHEKAGNITSNISYESNVKVKELITNHLYWNTSKINAICLPFEAKTIMSVPITGPNVEDKSYWRFETKESYSVKSWYWNYLRR